MRKDPEKKKKSPKQHRKDKWEPLDIHVAAARVRMHDQSPATSSTTAALVLMLLTTILFPLVPD